MPIKRIWTTELEDAFDVEQLASRVLDNAMEALESDDFVQAAVFFVTSKELHCYSVSFTGYDEKEATYQDVVRTAQEINARALVTLNDAYTGDPKTFDPATYEWGQLAANHKGECVFVSVSGPGLENWSKEVQYRRENGRIVFSEPEIERMSFLGLLQNWAKKGQRVK